MRTCTAAEQPIFHSFIFHSSFIYYCFSCNSLWRARWYQMMQAQIISAIGGISIKPLFT